MTGLRPFSFDHRHIAGAFGVCVRDWYVRLTERQRELRSMVVYAQTADAVIPASTYDECSCDHSQHLLSMRLCGEAKLHGTKPFRCQDPCSQVCSGAKECYFLSWGEVMQTLFCCLGTGLCRQDAEEVLDGIFEILNEGL